MIANENIRHSICLGSFLYGVQYCCALHDHPSYLCCPDELSLVGDPLSGKGVVHRITYSFNYFFFTCSFIYSIYSWYKIMERYIQ